MTITKEKYAEFKALRNIDRDLAVLATEYFQKLSAGDPQPFCAREEGGTRIFEPSFVLAAIHWKPDYSLGKGYGPELYPGIQREYAIYLKKRLPSYLKEQWEWHCSEQSLL